MSGRKNENRGEGYADFSLVYDQALGARFFEALRPVLDALIDRYPCDDRTHVDLACGTGLVLRHFASRGFVSVGVDASLPMLHIAAGRASRLVAGDLRSVPLRGPFSRLTCLYDSLNHMLSMDDLIRAFASARELMHERSLFFFDMNHPDVYPDVWGLDEPYVSVGPTHRLVMATSYSGVTGRGEAALSGWAKIGGKKLRIVEQHSQRSYSERQIREALAMAGLRVVDLFGFDPFEEASGERSVKMFVVAGPR